MKLRHCWAWIGAWALGAPWLAAQEEQPAEAPKAAPAAAEAPEGAAAPPPEDSPYLAVVGGDVYTVADEVVYGGTVLIKGDRILKIGRELRVPEGARRIDATGMRVYPGLVAVNANGLIAGGNKPLDSFDPFALNVDLGLAGGITTVQAGGAVGKLTRGTLDGHLLAQNVWLNLSYGTTAPAARRKLREDLDKAREFLRLQRAAELAKALGEKDVQAPSEEGVNKEYVKLLQGQAVARFNAESLGQLLAVCELLEEYPLRAVVFGGQEAWACAARLGRSGARLVITPRAKAYADPRLNRPSGWTIENARQLYEAGVEFAILPREQFISTGGTTGRDLLTLPLEAAFAIRGGLPQEAALRALTLDAAKCLGVEDRVGSLEPGKDADLIVVDGDLFDYRSFVQWAVVNGRVAYDKQVAPYFSHIRPRAQPPTAQELLEEIRRAAAEQAPEPAEEAPAPPEQEPPF